MKRNLFWGVLGIEAVLCIILHILQASFSNAFSTVMAFPFEQIGWGLRILSLSGGPGNAAAIVIYAAVSLLPAGALYVKRKKSRLHIEDGLLVLLSAVLFVVLYHMINPGLISSLTNRAAGASVGKALLGGMVYSVLCGYLILSVLRSFYVGSTDKLFRYMSILLHLLNVLFVFIIFSTCIGNFLDSTASLQAGNMGNEHLLGASRFFLVLQFLTDALPYVMDIFIVFAALRLLREMLADRYSANVVTAARYISRLCAVSLTATVLSNIGLNLLQLLFARSLMDLNILVQIPIFSILFVLAALLLTRFAAQNKQLKDDNDMFI